MTLAAPALVLACLLRGQDAPPALPAAASPNEHGCYVSCLATAAAAPLAATGDMKGNVVLWVIAPALKKKAAFKAVTGPGVEKWVWSVVLSPDGKVLAAGSDDKTVWVWSTETGKLLRRVRGHEAAVRHVFLTPGGETGLSFDDRRSALTRGVQGEAAPKAAKLSAGEAAALSPDGKLLCYSDGNNTLLAATPVAPGKPRPVGPYCKSVGFSPDGSMLAKNNGTDIEVWSAESSKRVWSSKGHMNSIGEVRFAPDGKRVLSTDGVRLHVWDDSNGDEVGQYSVGGKSVATCMEIIPDGSGVLLGDREGVVTLHRMPN